MCPMELRNKHKTDIFLRMVRIEVCDGGVGTRYTALYSSQHDESTNM